MKIDDDYLNMVLSMLLCIALAAIVVLGELIR